MRKYRWARHSISQAACFFLSRRTDNADDLAGWYSRLDHLGFSRLVRPPRIVMEEIVSTEPFTGENAARNAQKWNMTAVKPELLKHILIDILQNLRERLVSSTPSSRMLAG